MARVERGGVWLALLGLTLGIVLLAHGRPMHEEYDSLETSYARFFNLEELIQKINIKRFREFQGKEDGKESNIPSIDLTQNAIANDVENPADNIIDDLPVSGQEPESNSVEIRNEETTSISIPETTTLKTNQIATEGNTDVIGVNSDTFFISKESINAALKYGYKILLKKIGGKVVPVGKVKFQFPTLIEIGPNDEEEIIKTTNSEEVEETAEPIASNPTVTEEARIVTEAIIVTTEAINIETTTTENQEAVEPNSVTTPSTLYLPPAELYLAPEEVETASDVLSSVVPLDNEDSENPVIETVMKLIDDTVDVIKDLEPGADVLVFNCAVPVDEVEQMLLTFTQNIETSLPTLREILDLANDLRNVDTKGKTKIGAELLILLETVLESIVPFEIPGCGEDESSSMIGSLSSIASQLDTVANYESNPRKSKALHDKATSLQLSSWALVQLKHAVKLFYSQDGICSSDSSSPSTILETLSRAVTGYVPVATIIGNQESVRELRTTARALGEAAEEIAKLEEAGTSPIPSASCDATFAEMGDIVLQVANALP